MLRNCQRNTSSLQVVFDNSVTASQARSLVMTSYSCAYYLTMTCDENDPDESSWTTFYGGRRSFAFLGGSFCPYGKRKRYVSIIVTHLSSQITLCCYELYGKACLYHHKTTSQTFCFLPTDAAGRTCICGVDEVYDAPTDTGDAGNWPFFPILSFNIGDTGDSWESVEYALGPLVCKQGD